MKNDENYTYRSMRDEREYGPYWYSGLWHILRPILVGVTVAVLVIGIGMTVWNKLYDSFLAPVDQTDTAEYSFEISSGQSLNRVASNLEAAGLIRSKTVFKYYCDFAGMGQKIQTGTYSLKKDMTMAEIADRLTTGDGNPLVRNITLIPGETVEEFAAKLVRDGVLEKAYTFLDLCRDGKAFREYYYIDDVLTSGHPEQRKYVLEGYLAPNTYEVYRTATEEEMIRKLLSQTEAAFPAELQERAEELGMTMDQALENGDLTVSSPYNTYQVTGLPVGPVCNPSPAAIRAALYPDETMIAEKYLYFCAKEPESGELYFSKTLEQHNRAVETYAPKWKKYDQDRGIR